MVFGVIYFMIIPLAILYNKGCFDKKYDLYEKTAVKLLMVSMVLLFMHYELVVGDLLNINEWWKSLLLSVAVSFLSVAVTVWFVERSFARRKEEYDMYRRAKFYSVAKGVMMYIDEFFMELERGSGVHHLDSWKDFYTKGHIELLLDKYIDVRKNYTDMEEGQKKVYDTIDRGCRLFSEKLIGMNNHLNGMVVSDIDCELWYLLLKLTSDNELVHFYWWYDFIPNERDKTYVYKMINRDKFYCTVEDIHAAYGMLCELYEDIHKDGRFNYVTPPVFVKQIS